MAGSQMSKAHQRQSQRHKAQYTAQFERTKQNKARRLWRALTNNPKCAASLAALQKTERTTLTRAGLPVDAPERAHKAMAAAALLPVAKRRPSPSRAAAE